VDGRAIALVLVEVNFSVASMYKTILFRRFSNAATSMYTYGVLGKLKIPVAPTTSKALIGLEEAHGLGSHCGCSACTARRIYFANRDFLLSITRESRAHTESHIQPLRLDDSSLL
jgi:bacterioferritin-associated ferredoxin